MVTRMRCLSPYSIDLLDKGDWLPGWENRLNITDTDSNLYGALEQAYIFQSQDTLKAKPYWGTLHWYTGGGFVANLGNTLEVKSIKRLWR